MTSFGIFYGSGGGNTELVCEQIQDQLQEKGQQADLINFKVMEDLAPLENYEVLILASPTYGHGLLERYADRFVRYAQKQKLDLQQKPVAVVGLGDMMYDADYFIEAAKILKEFAEAQNGKIVNFPLMIAKSPLPHLKTVVPKWVDKLLSEI